MIDDLQSTFPAVLHLYALTAKHAYNYTVFLENRETYVTLLPEHVTVLNTLSRAAPAVDSSSVKISCPFPSYGLPQVKSSNRLPSSAMLTEPSLLPAYVTVDTRSTSLNTAEACQTGRKDDGVPHNPKQALFDMAWHSICIVQWRYCG